MAARLGALARRIRAPGALLPLRGGGGGPVALGKPPTQPLPEEDELLWDDGSANPELCLDDFQLVSKEYALMALTGALGGLVLLGFAANYRAKTAPPPFAPKKFPYDNLEQELGCHKAG